MENLPEEIAMEILSRLPAESIIRCMCAIKSWYALSKNPSFVAKHLTNQCQSNNNLLFLKQTIPHYKSFRAKMYILSTDNIDHPEIVRLPSSIKLCGFGLTLIGHCGGLIALGDGREGIYVCNTATRESRTLPNASLRPIPYDRRDTIPLRVAYNNFLGFGYDHKINDYKIVRVVTFLHYETGWPKVTHIAEVFCLYTDSCWRELNVVINSSLHMAGDSDIREPYFNGVCYWWTKDDETRQKMLTSFHLADEVFTNAPLPTLKCYKHCPKRFSVGDYNNSVALYIHIHLVHCTPRFEIWVMKEFGVKESWTKQLTIDLLTYFYHLGFWNSSDNEFLYENRYGQLAIYNRVTLESKGLPLKGKRHNWTAISYRKTTTSVKSRVAVQPGMKNVIFGNLFLCRMPKFRIPNTQNYLWNGIGKLDFPMYPTYLKISKHATAHDMGLWINGEWTWSIQIVDNNEHVVIVELHMLLGWLERFRLDAFKPDRWV